MSTVAETRRRFTVARADGRARLDRLLADHVPALSRSRLKKLIETGRVSIAGETITEPGYRVKPGQAVTLVIPPPTDETPRAQAIPLQVAYEDDDLIVVNKPAGLVVHPAPGNPDRTLVNALLAHCGASLSGIGGVRRPGIVHRLDKDTSGLMVAAKNDAAHHGLSAQFATRRLSRTYRAVVWGIPRPGEGRIEGAIGRDPRNRKRMAVRASGGKLAVTRYRVLQSTGRTLEPRRVPAGDRAYPPDQGPYGALWPPAPGRCALWRRPAATPRRAHACHARALPAPGAACGGLGFRPPREWRGTRLREPASSGYAGAYRGVVRRRLAVARKTVISIP